MPVCSPLHKKHDSIYVRVAMHTHSEVHITGCVKLMPAARGIQEAGFAQPLKGKLALLSTQETYDCIGFFKMFGTESGFHAQWAMMSPPFKMRPELQIRSLEDFVVEERQRGLPSLPGQDPRFPQPPIYLCDNLQFTSATKSSSDRIRI